MADGGEKATLEAELVTEDSAALGDDVQELILPLALPLLLDEARTSRSALAPKLSRRPKGEDEVVGEDEGDEEAAGATKSPSSKGLSSTVLELMLDKLPERGRHEPNEAEGEDAEALCC